MGTAQRGRRSHPAALDGRRVNNPAITLREPEGGETRASPGQSGPEGRGELVLAEILR